MGMLKDDHAVMPALEARELLGLAARRAGENRRADDFLLWRQESVTAETQDELKHLLARRLKGEPLAYILGEWEFYGLTLTVTPSVLIPRPDTETLVERSLRCLGEKVRNEPQILDLCCGSACIGLALLKHTEDTRCTFADASLQALAVAECNIRRHKMEQRSRVLQMDALKPPQEEFSRKFDLVACNPPYITSQQMSKLDASVLAYEPSIALCGGSDGLEFYRSILADWHKVMKPDGLLVFECGKGQANDIRMIAEEKGYKDIETICDLSGIRRVIACRR